MTTDIIWTRDDMIAATVESWAEEGIDIDPADCDVIEAIGEHDEPCLVVRHGPDGRTSDEGGNAGRWSPDGRAL